MKQSVNFLYYYSLCLFILTLLQGSKARTLATGSVVIAGSTAAMNSNAVKVQNSTGNVQNNTKLKNATTVSDFKDVQHSNETAVTTKPAPTQSLEMSQATGSAVVTHILRQKRETEVTMPYDFDTMHLPCDFDHNGRGLIMDKFPNQCIWVWNNRYSHEGFYRVFKLYQLEAFFFGQYYERLKRFEVDPHTWDYSNTGI